MQALEPGDPRSIGGIRVLARIGAGGMAIVYLGRSAGGRALAVKVMHAELAGQAALRTRFRREVEASRLAGGGYSPAVVSADPLAALPWLATEFLPSVSLRDAIRAYGPLPVGALWPLAAGIAEALFSIHRAGIAHLDLKPANVLLTLDGPRLIDFGIARRISSDDDGPGGAGRAGGDFGLDEPAGSRGFMAPEQLAGRDAGTASDVFSYGATLAYAGTGSADSADSAATIGDDVLRSMVLRCQAPDPGARPTVPELIGHLLSVLPSVPASAGPWLPQAAQAEIERRGYEADNPPLPVPVVEEVDLRLVRRRFLIGAGAVVLAGGLGGGALALASYLNRSPDPSADPRQSSAGKRSSPAHTSSPTPTPTPTPTATPTPTPETRSLEFYLTGDTTLTTLTYTVNGKTETLRNVKLPWRKTVQVPALPQKSTWRTVYHFPPGDVRLRVLVDGFESTSAGEGSTREPGSGDHSGTV
ncbi:serine/threonine-protein kinase [Flindersiella endophytica]